METTRQFLQRRERELVQEVAELRAQLTPKEVELAEVRRAKSAIAKSEVSANLVTGIFRPEPGIAESLSSALGIGDPLSSSCRGLVPAGLSGRSLISEALSSALDNIFEGGPAGAGDKAPAGTKIPNGGGPNSDGLESSPSPYQHYTMKELVVKALSEHFPNGATAKQLLQFFAEAWDRHIKRENLSPQLSRLMQAGLLERRGRVWSVVKDNEALTDNSESAS